MTPVDSIFVPLDTVDPEPFTMFVIGDAGKAGEVLDDNAKAMIEQARSFAADGKPLKAMAFLGDNFYPNGLNRIVGDYREVVDEILGPLLPVMLPLGAENVHSVPGNHDYYCDMWGPIPYGACNQGNQREEAIPFWTYRYLWPRLARYPVHDSSTDSVDLFLLDTPAMLTTEPRTWGKILDSLETLMRKSSRDSSVKWRLFFAHHSPYSVGEHNGWRVWNPRLNRVTYLGNCAEEQDDPVKYVQGIGYHEDNCTPRYQSMKDSLFDRMENADCNVQVYFGGHDHSLQLMNYGITTKRFAPKIFVISGAGGKVSLVREPYPPFIYTHPRNDMIHRGESAYGFVTMVIEDGVMKLQFIDGEDGEPLDMGGLTEFLIDQTGKLVHPLQDVQTVGPPPNEDQTGG